MSIGLRIILILISIITLFYMLKKIRQSKLQIEYTIFWILFAIILIFISVFPGVVYWMTGLIGIQSPVNLVFLVIIFVLIIKNFVMTIEMSQIQGRLKELIQKIALNEVKNQENNVNGRKNKK